MGTWYQSIVDRDANEDEAKRLAKEVAVWLAEEGVIERHLEHCVLGQDDLGYRPAKDFLKITDYTEDFTVSNCDYASFSKQGLNGLEIITKRHVSVNYQGEFEAVLCPACGGRITQDDQWSEAVTEWYENKGPGALVCPHCEHGESVAEWEHIDPVGFGLLTFTFWEWPPLSQSFIEQLSHRLGHKTILISGKL